MWQWKAHVPGLLQLTTPSQRSSGALLSVSHFHGFDKGHPSLRIPDRQGSIQSDVQRPMTDSLTAAHEAAMNPCRIGCREFDRRRCRICRSVACPTSPDGRSVRATSHCCRWRNRIPEWKESAMPQATAVASLHSFGATPSRTGPIIVAVGGREPEATLRAARVLARHSPKGVLAIAVLEPLPIYSLGEEPQLTPLNFETERRDALAARLSELVREHSQEPAAWRTDVSFGDPARAIAEVAEREKSPLIIMGIGRHHTVDRLLQRETVIRTLRVTRCPVLAVCGELASEPRQVVAGTDCSPESACAAEVALTLMDAAGTISYVHAWQLSTLADPAFADVLAGIDERYERLLPARFDRFHSAVATPPGITVRDITSRGAPAQELVHHAERLHADLIVVGRHGMGSLERLLVGSVASVVLRRATCSVLVAPAPRAAELERV